MKKQFLYIFLAVFSIGIPAQAITNQDVEEAATLAEKYQQHKKAKVYEFSVKAGFNIGGTSPIDRRRCHTLVLAQMGCQLGATLRDKRYGNRCFGKKLCHQTAE